MPERTTVQVDMDVVLQRGGEHGHDFHVGSAVGQSFSPSSVVTRPDRPDAAQDGPQPGQPLGRIGDVVVEYKSDVSQKNDFSAGVGVETGDAVIAPVSHMFECDPAALPAIPGLDLRPLKEVVTESEMLHIRHVLKHTGGHKARAAEILGISRKNLWEKMKDFELEQK